MKITLSVNTTGIYGGSRINSISSLIGYIEEKLQENKFSSSFEKLELTLCYIRKEVPEGIKELEKKFEQYYITLPYSRLNRKYKNITVSIQAPEFTEYYTYIFEKRKGNKPGYEEEVELSYTLISKLKEVLQLVSSKLKKEDIFDFKIFEEVLDSVEKEITPEFLSQLTEKTGQKKDQIFLQRVINEREERKSNLKPKNKQIRDIRIYHKFPNRALYPYDYIYSHIFLNLLQQNNFMCPEYDHLYISVAESEEEALQKCLPAEKWFTYGISVLNYQKYPTLSEKEREQTIFTMIVAGLKDIAVLDKLDISIINNAAKKIQKEGMDTELIHKTIENEAHEVTISYFFRKMNEKSPVYLTIKDKHTKKENKQKIGEYNGYEEIYYNLQKVTLTRKQIKIEAGNSYQAQMHTKNYPQKTIFQLSELI